MGDIRQTDARQMVSVEAEPARTQPNNITLCKFDDIEICIFKASGIRT